MSHHKKIFVNPSHIKKIFANMKREGKDFSRRITPLFDTMMVHASEEKKQKSKRKQRKETEVALDKAEHEESEPTPSNDPLPSGSLEKAKSDQAIEIASLKKRVDKLEKRRKYRTTWLKRLKKVSAATRIESLNDSLGAQ
ncbi:hypothetical protein Tco_1372135 [Tanacetum coccineum]